MTSIESQIRNACRHFNGIGHDVCEMGVAYDDVRDTNTGGMYAWPCLLPKRTEIVCPHFAQYSDDEIRAQVAAIRASHEAFAQSLEANKCPECGAAIVKKEQVGRCVYARPCNHRLYQGKVSP